MRFTRESIEITDERQWHNLRQKDLTASRIGSLFGLSPYTTLDDLAKQLRGTVEKKRDVNGVMRAGRILEPGVVVAISDVQPTWKMSKATTYHRIPELRLGATPDYWLGDDGLIQIGTVGEDSWERLNHSPPPYKIIQTVCEMFVTGRKIGWLAILVRDTSYKLPLYLFPIPCLPEIEERLVQAVEAWWYTFDNGLPLKGGRAKGLLEALGIGKTPVNPREAIVEAMQRRRRTW